MLENLTLERAALRAEWQQKTIKDDPIFGTVMTNPELCAELLRRALPELAIKWVKDTDPQHTIQATPTAKGIRIDVYARDDQERTYTMEKEQDSNRFRCLALAKLTRVLPARQVPVSYRRRW
ncbi:hypothetical protein [Limosilactobacillus ingluviei]|uniref:hypothetical protein n=1 Tax=Limosilactobacillus ingluviei TaxID=148604 RepID=UPI00265EB7EB|nr:hypothetical protein [Limosilactobacillus ingluviei]